MEIAEITNQLSQFIDFRADFLGMKYCGEGVVYAERVTYNINSLPTNDCISRHEPIRMSMGL